MDHIKGTYLPADLDPECYDLCVELNKLPGLRTFESCCGHLKEVYSIWFFCDNIDALSRLGRTVERNYSDGNWEIVLDSTDTSPRGVFWLRSKKVFGSNEEMMESIEVLINGMRHWFKQEFDEYFSRNQI